MLFSHILLLIFLKEQDEILINKAGGKHMNQITQEEDISMTKGDTCIRQFYIKNEDNQYIDIDSRSHIYMTVRNRITNEKIFELYYSQSDQIANDSSPIGGIEKTTDENNNPLYKVIIRPENTKEMDPAQIYEYDIEIDLNGAKFTAFYGRFELKREVTYPIDEIEPSKIHIILKPYLLNQDTIISDESVENTVLFESINGNTLTTKENPTPTNKSILKGAYIDYLMSTSNNIFNYENIKPGGYYDEYGTWVEDYSFVSSEPMHLITGNTYQISAAITSGNSISNPKQIVTFWDENLNFLYSRNIYSSIISNVPKNLVTFPDDAYYMRFNLENPNYIQSGSCIGIYLKTITCIDSTNPIYCLPEQADGSLLCDSIRKVNNTWCVEQALNKYTFIGNENLTLEKAGQISFCPDDIKISNSRYKLYCTHYSSNVEEEIDNNCFATEDGKIIINDSVNATSVANYKAYLAAQSTANTPLEVIYPRRYLTWIECDSTTKETLDNVPSYNNLTQISTLFHTALPYECKANLNCYIYTKQGGI